MEHLASIFQNSFRKGDKSIPMHNPDTYRLHVSALTAWGLLLSISPQWLIDELVVKYVILLFCSDFKFFDVVTEDFLLNKNVDPEFCCFTKNVGKIKHGFVKSFGRKSFQPRYSNYKSSQFLEEKMLFMAQLFHSPYRHDE